MNMLAEGTLAGYAKFGAERAPVIRNGFEDHFLHQDRYFP